MAVRIGELLLKEKRITPEQLQEALTGTSFETIDRNGFQLVAQGVASFDEIDKAVGM